MNDKNTLKNIKINNLVIPGDNRDQRAEYAKTKIFIPAFENSKLYCRSTGSFSSSFLILYSKHIAQFVKNGGTIKIISENKLRKKDQDLIRELDLNIRVYVKKYGSSKDSELITLH